MRDSYDIVVVGAGPAGAMAARQAALVGRTVALLERKTRVGIPVRCGEGIGFKGLTRSLEVREAWVLATIRSMKMVSPSGVEVNVTDTDESYVVDRSIMDADLVNEARNAGAEYFPETPVLGAKRLDNGLYECHSNDRSFRARCVIIADGVESRIARDLGWDTHLATEDIHSCCFGKVRHRSIAEDVCALYYGSTVAPGGYAWVFPRGAGIANVGLGVLGARCSPGEPRTHLERFVGRRFPGAELSDIHCGGVPAAPWLKPLVRDGAMVVGDAARQVNCVSGGGIAYALHAGRTAGTVAAEAFDGDRISYRALRRYEKIWAADCGRHQRMSYRVKCLMLAFSDAQLDKIASSLTRRKGGAISLFTVFARAFITRPLVLIRSAALFR